MLTIDHVVIMCDVVDNKGGGEEGWEQSGRAGSSRNARTSARGSHTPHILQRPDKAPGAWGNANASNGASQVSISLCTLTLLCNVLSHQIHGCDCTAVLYSLFVR